VTVGYDFTPTKSGKILGVAARIGRTGTYTVNVYSPTTILRSSSVNVTAANTWTWTNFGTTALPAIPVTAGTTYTVAVVVPSVLFAQPATRYTNVTLNRAFGSVTINRSVTRSGTTNPTTFASKPTTAGGTTLMGTVDIKFQAN
jgi:Domain of unknown function (DUF4082)